MIFLNDRRIRSSQWLASRRGPTRSAPTPKHITTRTAKPFPEGPSLFLAVAQWAKDYNQNQLTRARAPFRFALPRGVARRRRRPVESSPHATTIRVGAR